jgi:leader peptidase (prepilin peptidase)/N-methyltransferase
MLTLVLIIGLILGSFLNVVIHRLPQGQSIVWPGSRCPSCLNLIRPYDNIPIVSYILLGGRCRFCQASISWRYPLIEGLTAICLGALYLRYDLSGQFWVYGMLTLFLIPLSFIDLDHGILPNKLTIPGFILGLFLGMILQIEAWTSIAIGALFGGGIMFLISLMGKMLFHKESLGMGDVKLLVMIGVYVGFPWIGVCLFFGILIAALVILISVLRKKLRFGNTIPFGPFIAIGTLVFLLWGDIIVRTYLSLF